MKLRKGHLRSRITRSKYVKWTKEEHKKFVKAINLYGNSWRRISKLIETRSCAQIRSHAQKYYIDLRANALKNAINEGRRGKDLFVVYHSYRNRTLVTGNVHQIECESSTKKIKSEIKMKIKLEKCLNEDAKHDLVNNIDLNPNEKNNPNDYLNSFYVNLRDQNNFSEICSENMEDSKWDDSLSIKKEIEIHDILNKPLFNYQEDLNLHESYDLLVNLYNYDYQY